MPAWLSTGLQNPVIVALATAIATWWLTKRTDLAKVKRERTVEFKVGCYAKLVAALNNLAIKLAVERGCASDGKRTALATVADMTAAREAVLTAHVCGCKRLVDAAWSAFYDIIREQPEKVRATDALCRLITEIRADVGLDLAPFDQTSVNEAERLMVQSCCMRERYSVTVTTERGQSATVDGPN